MSRYRGIEALLNGQSPTTTTSEADPGPQGPGSVVGGPYAVSGDSAHGDDFGVQVTAPHAHIGPDSADPMATQGPSGPDILTSGPDGPVFVNPIFSGPGHPPGQVDPSGPDSGTDPLYQVPNSQNLGGPDSNGPFTPDLNGPYTPDPNGPYTPDPLMPDVPGPVDPTVPQVPDPTVPTVPDPTVPQVPDPTAPQTPDPSIPQVPSVPTIPGENGQSGVPSPSGGTGSGTGTPSFPDLGTGGPSTGTGGPSTGNGSGNGGSGDQRGNHTANPKDPGKTREVKHDAVADLGKTIYSTAGATAEAAKKKPHDNHIAWSDCGFVGIRISGRHGEVCAGSASYIEAVHKQMATWRDDLKRSGDNWKATHGDVLLALDGVDKQVTS